MVVNFIDSSIHLAKFTVTNIHITELLNNDLNCVVVQSSRFLDTNLMCKELFGRLCFVLCSCLRIDGCRVTILQRLAQIALVIYDCNYLEHGIHRLSVK